jgi:hypothetical protein
VRRYIAGWMHGRMWGLTRRLGCISVRLPHCNVPSSSAPVSSNCIDVLNLQPAVSENTAFTSCNSLRLTSSSRATGITLASSSDLWNLCSMNSSGLMTASLTTRPGCPLASFYPHSQQTSLPVFTYPTNGYSGSYSQSSSYGTSPTWRRPRPGRGDAKPLSCDTRCTSYPEHPTFLSPHSKTGF